jgi:hypothetical protein
MDAEFAGLLGLGGLSACRIAKPKSMLGPASESTARCPWSYLKLFSYRHGLWTNIFALVVRGSSLERLFMSLYGILYEIIRINQSHS